jgi:hypothetical protein
MFCPKCGCEYRKGFTQCAECKIALVCEPPDFDSEGQLHQDVSLVEVYATYNQAEIAMVKAVLEAENIAYHAQGDFFHMSGFHPTPVRFLVPATMVHQAQQALSELNT